MTNLCLCAASRRLFFCNDPVWSCHLTGSRITKDLMCLYIRSQAELWFVCPRLRATWSNHRSSKALDLPSIKSLELNV
ncbi:hypothetical protein BGY98DRAFT_981341 [Russula aff. rugulosa BPL654]|nr:hypothetical protein BGY98DRAFT_981341 [Russula aff. rugulosa BPL654]